MTQFRRRCKEIAGRFLQTVVIIDDEAFIGDPPPSPRPLVTPDRHTPARGTSDEAQEAPDHETRYSHSLNAGVLVESFSRRGLVCAVVTPQSSDEANAVEPNDIVAPATKRADIVILDWRLNNDYGERTMSIFKDILESDGDGRLRLIAVYTGEQDISRIGQTILQELDGFEGDEHNVVLSRGHCRIVIYAKSATSLAPNLVDRSVSESDMPERLIGDFSNMTEGLLPSMALTSLATIRENAHRILDRFDAKLDPAFLTHRACLPFPDESQQHMTTQLASELHALMSDTVATRDPAGMETIEDWLNSSLGTDTDLAFGEGKTASRDETIALLKEGFGKRKPNDLSKTRGFRQLTRGFSNGEDADNQLDRRLAWMFNFRTVFNAPSPILRLGSVLRRKTEYSEGFFLCMRPTCDSVRLSEITTFPLLPLVEPAGTPIQIVLRTGTDMFRRVGVSTKIDRWLLTRFIPNQERESIVAERDDTGFYFIDSDRGRFDWLGELKPEFAQRVAQEFASGLSRVAVDDSEWLRRETGI